MKLLSPSSTTYEGDTGSCLAGVLRRIFRSNSLRNAKVEELDPVATTPVPGIVARLMGLETLPQTMKTRGEKSPGAVTRSRSMNELDYNTEKCDEDGDGNPRSSIKSTSSFPETSMYLEIEDEEFLVLIFKTGTETEGSGGKKRKKRRNRTSILMRKNSTDEQLRNVESDQREVIAADKQSEIHSSSPVSVLEFGEFIASDLEASSSSDDGSENRIDGDLLHESSLRRIFGSRSLRRDVQPQLRHPEARLLLSEINSREVEGTWKYEEASGDVCSELVGLISDELIDDLIVQLSLCARVEQTQSLTAE